MKYFYSEEGVDVNVVVGDTGVVHGFTKKEVGTKMGKGKRVKLATLMDAETFGSMYSRMKRHNKLAMALVSLARQLGPAFVGVTVHDEMSEEDLKTAIENIILKFGQMAGKVSEMESEAKQREEHKQAGGLRSSMIEAVDQIEESLHCVGGWVLPVPEVTCEVTSKQVRGKKNDNVTQEVTEVKFRRVRRG